MTSIKRLDGIYLPNRPAGSLWDVIIEDNAITSIKPYPAQGQPLPTTSNPEAHSLLLPTLCHPHVHLDKPYLLCSSHQQYEDLVPTDGTFSEALANTSKAKTRYDLDDLLLRGSQLIVDSVKCGVTSMRAFVEIDHVTKFQALEAGIELKRKFSKICLVQLVAFAQDPIMSGDHGHENRELLIQALERYGEHIDVVGTTPYVESGGFEVSNIDWAIETALKYEVHLDFHLDYNLDPAQKSYVWDVISSLETKHWNKMAPKGKTIVVGHCTRISIFSNHEMLELAERLSRSKLPLSFVGLPTSDLFMMGRPSDGSWAGQRPRGTLQVLELIDRFGINAAMGVNNVGNAFTPWGNVDPLRLASLGVGIYQAGTEKDAETLLACVGWRARAAIGIDESTVGDSDKIEEGSKGRWMLIKNRRDDVVVSGSETVRVPARQWRRIRDVVWDPPEVVMREVVA